MRRVRLMWRNTEAPGTEHTGTESTQRHTELAEHQAHGAQREAGAVRCGVSHHLYVPHGFFCSWYQPSLMSHIATSHWQCMQLKMRSCVLIGIFLDNSSPPPYLDVALCSIPGFPLARGENRHWEIIHPCWK
jgi:hypothetical protein